ncbi:HAD hydrolase-like protein [Streptomyces sp. NBC_01335]|uniref:HAD family hydrolase n=1 Tax=Streptomyces sp. NBC_01335 TaxID=2903828 RepID=UPI002E140AA2|nr:HAD hydrolase-like protein [Streptomyces sp. NBC_01335]
MALQAPGGGASPARLRLPQAAVIGFDLDLTLVDTRPATALALRRVNEGLGLAIDADAVAARIGPPLRELLSPWVPARLLRPAAELFLAAFLELGEGSAAPMPGAAALMDAVRSAGGRCSVITSRRDSTATACLRWSGLRADSLDCRLSGPGKADAMRARAVAAYVGDHPLDVAGALAAGVPAVGVTTGAHSAAELLAAGADFVAPSLHALRPLLTPLPSGPAEG